MNFFERTRQKREEDAGLKEKSKPKDSKKETNKKTMSQPEFSGYKSPSQSKKWVEK